MKRYTKLALLGILFNLVALAQELHQHLYYVAALSSFLLVVMIVLFVVAISIEV
jgi:hypothetical protein